MISVILPVYNVEDKVIRAIDSVLFQPEVSELIVVDDGSKDATLSIVSEYLALDKRIRRFSHPDGKNHGASATRNLGVEKSKNDLVAFLDADDYYLEGRFKGLVHQFSGDYDAFCNTIKKQNLDLKEELVGVSSDLYDHLITGTGWVHLNGFVIKKSKFNEIGGFNRSLVINQDTDLLIKASIKCKIAYGSSEPVAMWVKATNTLSDVSKKSFLRDYGKMWRQLLSWSQAAEIDAQYQIDFLVKAVHNFNSWTRKSASTLIRNIILVFLILKYPALLIIHVKKLIGKYS